MKLVLVKLLSALVIQWQIDEPGDSYLLYKADNGPYEVVMAFHHCGTHVEFAKFKLTPEMGMGLFYHVFEPTQNFTCGVTE